MFNPVEPRPTEPNEADDPKLNPLEDPETVPPKENPPAGAFEMPAVDAALEKLNPEED